MKEIRGVGLQVCKLDSADPSNKGYFWGNETLGFILTFYILNCRSFFFMKFLMHFW